MKLFSYFIAFLILLVALTLFTLRFTPQYVVSVINSNSDYKLQADLIKFRYFPPRLELKQLTLSKQGAFLANFEQLKASTTWATLRKQAAPFASVFVTDGNIDVEAFSKLTNQQSPNTKSSNTNFFEMANSARITAENILIKIDESSSVVLRKFENSLIESKIMIRVSANYNKAETTLDIEGNVFVENQAMGNSVSMQIKKLDLNNLLVSQDSLSKTTKSATSENSTALPESEIDWSWMTDIGNTAASVTIDDLLWPNGHLQNLNLNIESSESIKIEANGKLNLSFDTQTASGSKAQANFNDHVSIESNFKPLSDKTHGIDIAGSLTIKTPAASIAVQGEFDLDGMEQNITEFDVNISSVPDSLGVNPELLNKYMPVNATGKLAIQKNGIDLAQLKSSLADSDMVGDISINFQQEDAAQLKFYLKSNHFEYHTAEEKTDDRDSTETGPLLSPELIDWAWMSKTEIQGQIKIGQFKYGKLTFDDVSLPINLTDQVFDVGPLTSEINTGAFEANLTLRPNEQGVIANTSIDFSDIDMSKSRLFKDGEISGVLVDGKFTLDSNGQSMNELASNSNGKLFVGIGQGVIAQGGAEILGSDLILSTLSKLNPFTKADSSTNLKCAVLNLEIEDGVVHAKNSIALETSKVAIVGTGKINLSSEKLDLKFNPKPKKSIGVNFSSLAKAVKIGGSIRQPKPVVSALGIAEAGLSIGTAISTGGLSLLAEGLMDGVSADQACVNARKAFNTNEPAPEESEQSISTLEAPTKLQEIDLSREY